MSFSRQLTEDTIKQLDRSNMREVIAAMPMHLRDALSRAQVQLSAASLRKQYSNIVLGGLGGSAIGGDLVKSYLGSDLPIPFEIVRGYDLPASVNEMTLFIVSSYSGNTEESLSLFDAAIAKGISPVCIAAGGRLLDEAKAKRLSTVVLPTGFQPRAALAYSFVSVLIILEAAGVTSGQAEKVEAAALHAGALAERFGDPSGEHDAMKLAKALVHSLPVIYSASDVLGSINVRWRGQLQENAKHLAFGNVLPEMNHNEINSWEHPRDLVQHFSALMLRSPQDEHPRVQKRFEVLEEILRDRGLAVLSAQAEGNDRLSRIFSLIILGDWVSFYLAMLTDVDPTPIPAIDKLKRALS